MIRELHERLTTRKISSLELTKQYLGRVKQDTTNSFITVSEDIALAMAKQADERIAKGTAAALTGIPIALKDVLCTQGIRTTCASKILGDYVPPYDATSVARLKNESAVFLGKLNMDEFAMGGSNENSAFGPVKNPVNLEYVPGGSSGGSAAAVKAGLAVATLGTDTGGSVRLPAAYTGTVGLKPTYGRVSRFGLVAFASSLDQIGPLANSTEDCAFLLSAISGHDEFDSTSANRPAADYVQLMSQAATRKLKIGIPKEYFIGGLQPEVQAALDQVKAMLKKAGHTLVDVSLPHTEYAVAVYYIVAVSEASSNLARFDGSRFGARMAGNKSLLSMYKETRAQFGDEVKRRILLGTFALSAGYYDAYYKKACQVRRLIKQDFDAVYRDVDVILAPVSPTTAFKLGEKTSDPLTMYLNDIFTISTNLAGLPAISVPAGRDSKGLPIGVQFLGRHFGEPEILAMAKFVEENVYREEAPNAI
jgi:aspartyl-tRNA(Asn)/glutamyl-tRNA(Gln) amidotransferase subunit A